MENNENQNNNQEEQDKIPIPKWRYIFTPIFMYAASIIIFAVMLGKKESYARPLAVGAAIAFALIVLWIIQTAMYSKDPTQKYKSSTKQMLLMGIYSFIFLIVWEIFVLIIF